MGIFTDLRKSCRNRENYKDQLRRANMTIENRDREIKELKRKLAVVKDYVERALA